MKHTPIFLFLFFLVCVNPDENRSSMQPTGAALRAKEHPAFHWVTHETRHFRIHALPGTRVSKTISKTGEELEEIFEENLRTLGVKDYPFLVYVFYITHRRMMKAVSDASFRAMADIPSRAVFMTIPHNRNEYVERHEIMHVLSENIWGPSYGFGVSPWLTEGMSTHAGKVLGGRTIDEIASHIMHHGKYVPLDSLCTRFREYEELVKYPLAGSFMGYLLRTYELRKVRKLWKQGIHRFRRIFKESLGQAEARWREEVRQKYPSPEFDWEEWGERLGQDTGYRIQDTGYRIQEARYKKQDTRSKIQDVRCKMQEEKLKIRKAKKGER